jgi:hypothetical protein
VVVLELRVHKMFNALEMKLPVMGTVGEKKRPIASRWNMNHCVVTPTKFLVESLD